MSNAAISMNGAAAVTPIPPYVKRSAATVSIALLSLGVAGLAPSRAIAQDASDEWQFSATLYGWLPDIGGQTQAELGDGNTIDVDVGTILDHLKMTFQGSFEIHKGQWGAFTDLVYLDVGDTKSETRGLEIGGQPLPGSVEAAVEFDLKTTIWTLAGSYRALDNPGATVDWLAGARLASFKQEFDWEFTGDFGPNTPPPLTGSSDASVDQWDLIVGVKGRLAYGADQQWVVPFYFDVGTGDSDMTWQAMLGFGYAFGWGDLGVAWRYMEYDLKSDASIADMNFNGPALGATFRW